MPLIYTRDLGDNSPNYVEPGNNPDQSAPWLTDYAAPGGPALTLGPMRIISAPAKKKTTAKASSTKTTAAKTATIKIALKRAGAAGALLDKLLPLVVDQAGNRTIYGLPPVVVYLAGGVISSTLLVYLYRLLMGGGKRDRRVSNPKRAPARRRRRAKR